MASLCALLAHPDPQVRVRSGEVLLELDAAQHLPLVLRLLEDADVDVRFGITSRLWEFGDGRAVDPLMVILLHEPDSSIRWYAILALKSIGDARALPALEHVVQYDDGVNFEGTPLRDTARLAVTALLGRNATGNNDL